MTELVIKTKYSNKAEALLAQFNDELEEHLSSINDNNSEIQENYTFMCELDNKIAKLNTRIDEIHGILSKMTGKKIRKMPAFEDIDPLNEKEKIVFLHLYTKEKPITFEELSNSLDLTIEMTRQYVLNLMEKGIPIQKIYKQTRPYIMLDQKFKNIQAKKNILKIEQRILV